LGQVFWRKVQTSEIADADKKLIAVTYNLIAESRHQLARIHLDFAMETLKTHATEDYQLKFAVNSAQTDKWTANEERCKEILTGEDWTATNSRFKLAHAVLVDDFNQANVIVKQIGTGDLDRDKHAYREWPLFRELRKSPEFAATFEQIFGEPLNKLVVEDTKAKDSTPRLVN
jgi:hypothetical protein